MKLLMPSHVKRVKPFSDPTPIFQRYGVEDQLSAMYQPVVQLKSGGYLVINPTEALVSIDINSGRSTREHNIEQTAFATNLEAAAEVARQLRLRDMAGLIVIDFIDMEQSSHVRKVEKAMKEALRNDRARIQVGRISSFGLMEMSRQRLRTGVLEASTKSCPHCDGTGLMRTASSAGLSALRIIEDEAARGRGEKILLRAGREAAIYLLNKKRAELAEIEERYGVTVEVIIEESFEGARMSVESSGPRPSAPPRPAMEAAPIIDEDDDEIVEDEEEEEEEEEREVRTQREPREGRDREEGEGGPRRRRRRRRGGRGRRRDGEGDAGTPVDAAETAPEEAEAADAEPAEEQEGKPKSRRGRRGGRGRQGRSDAAETVEADSSPMVETPVADEALVAETEPAGEAEPVPSAAEGPKTRRRPRARKPVPSAAEGAIEEAAAEPAPAPEPEPEAVAEEAPKPKRKSRARKTEPKAEEPVQAAAVAANDEPAEAADQGEDGEPRRGWWQKTFG
jgi:ribonuclease E